MCNDRIMSLFEKHVPVTDEDIAAAAANYLGLGSPADLRVTGVAYSAAVNPGENFTSVMKAVDVTVEILGRKEGDRTAVVSLIGKFASVGSPMSEAFERMNIFAREVQFYSELLPRLESLSVGGRPLPFPRCPLARGGVILMENLKKMGFAMNDPKRGMSPGQLELAVSELARFHAASHHLLHTYPGGEAAFSRDFSCLYRPIVWDSIIADVFDGLFRGAVPIVAAHRPELLSRFEDFVPRAVKAGIESREDEDASFKVVCKADTWNNNFMFRGGEDKGKDTEVRFVDMQDAFVSRPTYDLSILVCSSTTPEYRRDCFHGLMELYHRRLASHLSSLGYSGETYTFQNLLHDYDKSFPFAFLFGIVNVQTVLAEDDGILELTTESSDAESFRKNMDSFVESGKKKGAAGGGGELAARVAALVDEAARRNVI